MDQESSVPNREEPDYLDFGQCELRALDLLQEDLNLSRNSVARMCKSLMLPLLHLGKRTYYNPATLQKVIHVLSRQGGPGFAFPGADYKRNQGRYATHVPFKLNQDLMDQIKDPNITLEMIAYTGRNKGASARFAQVKASIEGRKMANGRKS